MQKFMLKKRKEAAAKMNAKEIAMKKLPDSCYAAAVAEMENNETVRLCVGSKGGDPMCGEGRSSCKKGWVCQVPIEGRFQMRGNGTHMCSVRQYEDLQTFHLKGKEHFVYFRAAKGTICSPRNEEEDQEVDTNKTHMGEWEKCDVTKKVFECMILKRGYVTEKVINKAHSPLKFTLPEEIFNISGTAIACDEQPSVLRSLLVWL